MFTVTPPSKRPLSPSANSSNKTRRTSFSPSISDHLLRQKLALLPRDRLESLILTLAQFNPQSKQSILSLLPTLTPKAVRTFDTQLEPVLNLLANSYNRKNSRGLWAISEKINDRLQDAIASIVGVVQEYLSDSNVGEEETAQTWLNGMKGLLDLGSALHNCNHGEIRQSLMSLGSGHDVAEGASVLIPGLEVIEYNGMRHAKVVELRMGLGGLDKEMRKYANEEWVKPLKKLDEVLKEWVKEEGVGESSDVDQKDQFDSDSEDEDI
jgi:hypothetical protein